MAKTPRITELLEFEISFYQELLQNTPNHVDALTALGEAYTRRGLYEKGLEIDRRLTQLKVNDPVVWYNLACSLSLLKRIGESLQALQQAITLGYDDFEFLAKDPDLESLRRSPEFRRFVTARSATSP
jgi:tetratricopeptide (TPR) repeat protein